MNLNQWSLRSRLTVGILVLTALGFTASFIGTTNALKGYLVGQIDDQLNSIVGGTAQRLDRGARIQNNEEDDLNEHGRMRARGSNNSPQPLQRIPTTLSVTLLTKNGEIKGVLGGDLTPSQITDYLQGFTSADAMEIGRAHV